MDAPTKEPARARSPGRRPSATQAALRHATGERHARLDDELPLARADATLGDYADHLRVIAAWREAIAPWVVPCASDAQSDMAWALRDDLADCTALGATRVVPAGCDASLLREADDGSEAFRFGVTYVLEGSALGGRVLRGRLAARLAPHPLRYLRGSEKGAGARWASFLRELERRVNDARRRTSACAGACAAFDTLSSCYARAGVLR